MNQKPFVLWTRKAERINPPVAIFAACPLRDLAHWKQGNRWADMTPVIHFGGGEIAPFGRPFAADEGHGVPWRVENAPPAVWEGWVWETPETFPAAMEVWLLMVRRCVLALPPGPVWQIHGECDDGVCAIVAASLRQNALCLAAGMPGLIAASLAVRYGVDISQRDRSGDRGPV